jgi:hypothetical protein
VPAAHGSAQPRQQVRIPVAVDGAGPENHGAGGRGDLLTVRFRTAAATSRCSSPVATSRAGSADAIPAIPTFMPDSLPHPAAGGRE